MMAEMKVAQKVALMALKMVALKVWKMVESKDSKLVVTMVVMKA